MRFWIALLISISIFIGGCGEKKNKKEKTLSSAKENNISSHIKKAASPIQKKEEIFTIKDLDDRVMKIDINQNSVFFSPIAQNLVMVFIYSDKCAPCKALFPYISDIQKKNSKGLFIVGIPVKDEIAEIKSFAKKQRASFFISQSKDNEKLAETLVSTAKIPKNYPIPLILFFKNGKYLFDIEGAAPPEMIQSIIDQFKTI